MKMNRTRVEELLNSFSEQRIAVFGDLMLDRYVYGNVDRISPEAPVPVINVEQDKHVPGGACNVAMNIVALGGRANLCGVIGTDNFGNELLGSLNSYGVGTEGVFRSETLPTIVKTRVVADQQQVCRVDRERMGFSQLVESDAFLERLNHVVHAATGAIIEDYGKDTITQGSVNTLLHTAKKKGIPTGYDPKDNHALDVKGITFATPNRKETFTIASIADRGKESLLEAGTRLRKMWEPDFLMLTLGADGMMIFAEDEPLLVPTQAREVFDVSGAGDTVIATCMLALASGATPLEAATLSNYAAGVVVAKLGTATCSPAEVLNALG